MTEQVINDVKEAQKKYNLAVLNEMTEKLLRDQILDIAKPDHRIKQLIRKCLTDFIFTKNFILENLLIRYFTTKSIVFLAVIDLL